MSPKERGVTKLIVAVKMGSERSLLFSRKRAKGQAKHRLLELLGGHMDHEHDPLTALLAELDEEEKSGVLVEKISTERPSSQTLIIAGTTHFLFETELTLDQYLDLRHGKKESLGFKLIPQSQVMARELQWRFTPNTREILARMADKIEE